MKSDKLNKILTDKAFWFCFLIILTALARLFVISGNYNIYSWDAGNFALAVESFSLEDGRPHLPGYFLHVQFIRLLTSLTGDKFVSMNLFSVFYSAFAAGFIFLIVTRWCSILESVLFTLLVMTNPIVWFFGSVAEIYSFDLFASALLVWMGLSPHALIVTPSLMGLITGVRPSTGFLLLPLYIYFWQKHLKNKSISVRSALFYHSPAIIIILSWLAPMIIVSGGIESYLQLYVTNNPVEKITVLQNIFRFSSYMLLLIPPILIFLSAAIIKRNKAQGLIDILNEKSEKYDLSLLYWWLWPSLIFFIFIHYAKGYILICIVPILILVVFTLRNIGRRKRLLVITIFFQIVFFCVFPFNYPNPEIYMSPGQRQINLLEIWYERTTSEYLMSRSHIEALQECHEIIADAAESIELLVGDKNYLFFDPTVNVSPRAMQARYPNIRITKYLSSARDEYGFHYERIQEARRGLTSMLSAAMIISRIDFIEEYLSDLDIVLYKKDDIWGIFYISEEEAPRLTERYNKLFAR